MPKRKEQQMKRLTQATLFVVVIALLASLAFFAGPEVMRAAEDVNMFSFDVACDCRTGVTLDAGVRASPFMIQGKMFPPGTLPSGNATNDPTQPVHGIA